MMEKEIDNKVPAYTGTNLAPYSDHALQEIVCVFSEQKNIDNNIINEDLSLSGGTLNMLNQMYSKKESNSS